MMKNKTKTISTILAILNITLVISCANKTLSTNSVDPTDLSDCTSAESEYLGPAQIDINSSILEEIPKSDGATPADDAKPLNSSLSNELVSALDSTLVEISTKVPAANIAVMIPGKGIWSRTIGVPNADTVNSAVLFQVASITKAFTATVIFQLVHEKQLDISKTLDTWYPDIQHANLITVDQLMRHTSGIPNIQSDFQKSSQTPSYEELITNLSSESLLFCPGTNWSYSNSNYILLGKIIEKVEGKNLNDVFNERIFTPLGLSNTTLRTVNDTVEIATGHNQGEVVVAEDNSVGAYAAGGIASTATDLIKFWDALLSGRIIPDSTVQNMLSSVTAMSSDEQMYYGAGVMYYDISNGPGKMIGHSGGIIGFTGVLAYVVEDNAFVSVLFNDKSVSAEAGLWSIVKTIRNENLN